MVCPALLLRRRACLGVGGSAGGGVALVAAECDDLWVVRVTDVSEAQASGACGLPRGFALRGLVGCAPRCRARTTLR
jgi:hypothetical protein